MCIAEFKKAKVQYQLNGKLRYSYCFSKPHHYFFHADYQLLKTL